MIEVKITKGGTAGKRISITPNKIKEQFTNNLQNIMKIIFIAAGSSTRLGKLTLNFPKGLIKINNNSIIITQNHDIHKIQILDYRIYSLLFLYCYILLDI